jgi:porin
MTTSEIEALSTVRLSEAWYEHQSGERLAVKVGQLAADVEFHTRNFEGAFVNGTFGWPAITAANLPSGGPAYPFATPGVRVVIRPAGNDDLLFRAAVFNGDPAGPGANDPQERNRFGSTSGCVIPHLSSAKQNFDMATSRTNGCYLVP